jgi:hypothetical protein
MWRRTGWLRAVLVLLTDAAALLAFDCGTEIDARSLGRGQESYLLSLSARAAARIG